MELTEEELKKKIDDAVAEATKGLLSQEQVDKVVSERVNQINEKHKKEMEEERKVAKMTAEEKQKHEFEELTKERDELKSSLAKKDFKEKLTSLMSEKKIDGQFYDMFANIPDLETAGSVMDKFNESMKTKVEAEVESKIEPNVPGNNPNTSDDPFEQGWNEG